jgi:hypothetical protein
MDRQVPVLLLHSILHLVLPEMNFHFMASRRDKNKDEEMNIILTFGHPEIAIDSLFQEVIHQGSSQSPANHHII